jgi:hypothetical protein
MKERHGWVPSSSNGGGSVVTKAFRETDGGIKAWRTVSGCKFRIFALFLEPADNVVGNVIPDTTEADEDAELEAIVGTVPVLELVRDWPPLGLLWVVDGRGYANLYKAGGKLGRT